MLMSRMNLLQLDGAELRLGAQHFGPFSIQVKAAERVAILGPSGAGKSTLLKLMSRECTPYRGQVAFFGRNMQDWRWQELSHHRAVLPQSTQMAFGLPVTLVIGLGRVARQHDPAHDEVVALAAAQAHAAHLLARRFDTLSGGEQARVQLARVFAQLWDVRDGLILVDEPLAALDPGLQMDLLDSLEAYACQRRHAVVAILHDMNQAMQGFERLLLIKAGKIVGDLPSGAAAVPALEALFGLELTCLAGPLGEVLITPRRRLVQRAPGWVAA